MDNQLGELLSILLCLAAALGLLYYGYSRTKEGDSFRNWVVDQEKESTNDRKETLQELKKLNQLLSEISQKLDKS